jgi:hypothetical protein
MSVSSVDHTLRGLSHLWSATEMQGASRLAILRAEAISRSRTQVEREQRNLTLHNILELAEVLDTDPGDLVSGLRAPG